MFLKNWRKSLVIAILISQFTFIPLSYAQNQKIPARPVEPFYQDVSSELPKSYQPNVTYLSPLKDAPISFSSLGASWTQDLPEQTTLLIEVRVKTEEKMSDWYELDPEIDEKSDTESSGSGQSASAFLTTNQATAYQYRITLLSKDSSQTPVLDNLKFTFVDGGTPQQKTDLLLSGPKSTEGVVNQATVASVVKSTALSAQAESITVLPANSIKVKPVRRTPTEPNSASNLKIISRSEWGADESLRLYTPKDEEKEPKLVKFEDDYYTKFAAELRESKRITTDANGNLLTWPLSYPESIKKIIIHHTATTNNLEDPQKAIRDIYYWHTKVKGWGDIGYNYIIDQQGNIYEGRYGGEMVVGAHAGRGNHGSIGIALLGNYQDNEPPEAVVNSLTALVKEKAKLYNIDTEGSDLFRGLNYPNVMGHRDIMSTSCPGEKMYSLLPLIRKMAKSDSSSSSASQIANTDYNFSFQNSSSLISLDPKSRKTLNLTIINKGTKTWGKNTYFQIRDNQNSQLLLRDAGKNTSTILGKEVPPGETVQIQFALNSSNASGNALIDIFPVIDGTQKINNFQSFGLQVKTPAPELKYDYELVSIIYSKNEFKKGDLIDVKVRLRNKGLSPWQKSGSNKVMLGADKTKDHKNVLLETPSARLAGLEEELVLAGQVGTFNFRIKVPREDGLYREYFTPVVEGIQWMNNHDTFLQVKVGSSDQLMTPDSGDSDGDVASSSSFLKPASQGAGQPEAIVKFNKTSSSQTTSKPVTETVTTQDPTPTGSQTVNIAATKLDLSSVPRPIRVDLAYRGNPATISSDGDFSLYEGTRFVKDFSANQLVTVKYQDSVFKISSGNDSWNISAKPRFQPKNGAIMRIDNWERRDTWGAKANNNEFRGTLEVILYSQELHVINELSLEDYLKGLAEESASEPDEKIKAIMIIARTYARFYMDVAKKFPGAPFDLNDDPNYSQKYTGYSFEKRSAKTAQIATATAGKYVTYQGKLIKTPFFSKSDGKKTISAKDKWGWTDTPFLVSVDDSLCVSTAFSGHGVGLSGCGATAMAKLGKSFEEIIKYYYQGTEISQATY